MRHRRIIDPFRFPNPRHRYWRLLFHGIAGIATRIGLDEIEFWETPSGVKKLPSVVGASGFAGATTVPTYAVDGLLLGDSSNNEIWASNTAAPWWFSFDAGLGNDFELAAVALCRGNYLTTGFDTPTGFDVQWSDDNATWTTVWTESAISGGWNGWEVRTYYNPHYHGAPAPVMPLASVPQFWLKADEGLFRDAGVTPCADGDGIRQATNHGTDAAFAQGVAGNRPIFRTGGLNGKPYVEGNGIDQYFEDIALTIGSGLLVFPPWTVFSLSDNVDLTNQPAILGHATTVAKNSYFFRPNAGAQSRYVKAGLDYQDLTFPLSHAVWMEDSNRRVDYFNGQTTVRNVASGTPSAAVAASQFLRHAALGAGQGFWKGRLYEFVLFPGTLLSIETNRVEKYLRYKYGLAP